MKAAIALCLLLAACGTKERIVSVPCINAADLPAEVPEPVLTGNQGIDLGIMTDTALKLLDEAVKLRALTKGCV